MFTQMFGVNIPLSDLIPMFITFYIVNIILGKLIQTTGAFKASDVHHQFAIKFTTPPYPAKLDPSSHVHVNITQLIVLYQLCWKRLFSKDTNVHCYFLGKSTAVQTA